MPDLASVVPDVKSSIKGEKSVAFLEPLMKLMRRERPPDIDKHPILLPGLDAMYLDSVLDEDECAALCAAIDASEHLSFWSATGRENTSARLFRDADTIELDSLELADMLWKRIAPIVDSIEPIIVVSKL